MDIGKLRTYVVNLDRRVDRRRHMERQLPSDLPVVFTSDHGLAVDGWDLDIQVLRAQGYELFPWKRSSSNPYWARPLKSGEVGCTLSHLACWRDAITTDGTTFLILEDDVVLPETFLDDLLAGLDALAARRPVGLLYLLRRPLEPDRPAIPGFVMPGFSYWTCGYVLTRTAITALLSAGLEQAIIPADEFLPAMYMNHPREDVRARFPPRFEALAFDPPILGKLSRKAVGSDTRDSCFVR